MSEFNLEQMKKLEAQQYAVEEHCKGKPVNPRDYIGGSYSVR